MAPLDLPYLWGARGRKGRHYWYYRRAGLRVPITSANGLRLAPTDTGFYAAYDRIHASFETASCHAPPAGMGTIAHLIETYRAAPEFLQLVDRTRGSYTRYLDYLKAKIGGLPLATMPQEAVIKVRDDLSAKSRTANYTLAVLRLLLGFAAARKRTFRLPPNWGNPAAGVSKLRTGPGRRPWYDAEIDAYRRRWAPETLERVAFELALNTGLRGVDLVKLTRTQIHHGKLTVQPAKAGRLVKLPLSADLRAVLDDWLESHQHVVILTTRTGRPFQLDHWRHFMRAAYDAAGISGEVDTHALRHAAATILAENGASPRTIMAVTGQRTEAMARHYSEQEREAEAGIAMLDQARAARNGNGKVKTAADPGVNHRRSDD